MGVPKFYRWISERYPCLSEVVREYQIPEFDNLYLDMNGIIHLCSHPNDDDPHYRITEDKIFTDIFHYIEILFKMIKPREVFFMAVDGVAPRAKMNQQRGRRFRSAREAEESEKRALEKGETLPKQERFDSNCITPGTVFMAKLHAQLQYFVTMKISTDPSWRGIRIYLSGHETPGEGEHKIMEFIRHEKSKSDYNTNTRHCLYGLDADLIMLGLCTHEPHFSLLREEVRFCGKKSQKRTPTPEETTFHLLHLSLMREYLGYEFAPLTDGLPFPYNLENIIDDWVLMGFLVGNDFIPHLPHMHIAHDALPMLYKTYIDVLPTLDGYLNEDGVLNLRRFEKYLEKVSEYDYEKFNDNYADLKWLESKGEKRQAEGFKAFTNKSPSKRRQKCADNVFDVLASIQDDELQDASDDDPLSLGNNFDFPNIDDSSDEDDDEEAEEEENDTEEDLFEMEFRQHKRDYYMNKLEYASVTADVLRDQTECYVRAIQWNLHYYYNGVCSWSWYYPHHYAPYISDVKGFKDLKMDFDLDAPFLPFEQLLAVLPAASKKSLPVPYHRLMCDKTSPVIDFYPVDFKTDLNGKQQDWEAVVLIPFINEKRLLDAMKPIESELTDEERGRNKHGACLLYTYTNVSQGCYPSSLPGNLPDVPFNHARCQKIEREEFLVDPSQMKRGLCSDAVIDVYYLGFPTLKQISHTFELKKADIRVFQMTSRKESMILKINVDVTHEPDLNQIAKDYLGETVYVGWPHLVEARVISISDYKHKYSFVEDNKKAREPEIVEECLSNKESDIWYQKAESTRENCFGRFGIEVGEVRVLIFAQTLIGKRYVCNNNGKITPEKQWTIQPLTFPLQTIVKDITIYDSPGKEIKGVSDLYKTGSRCFMLASPNRGCMGEIVGIIHRRKIRVIVDFTVLEEPSFDDIFQNQHGLTLQYMKGYTVAQRLGISSLLLSRVTGTFFVKSGSENNPLQHRFNVGLNLKFNKKNKEIPGYTKKTDDGWLYSSNALNVMSEYMMQFPELFEYIAYHMNEESVFAEDIYPEGNSAQKLQEIQDWLKAQPFYKVQPQQCGTDIIEEPVVKLIEEIVEELKEKNKTSAKIVKMQVRRNHLYLPSLVIGSVIADPTSTYRLFDRVVVVREDHLVPIGSRGTVVGIYLAEKELDTMYDVVFDNEFVGGYSIRCSANRGYRLPRYVLMNLSENARHDQSKIKPSQKPMAVVHPQSSLSKNSGVQLPESIIIHNHNTEKGESSGRANGRVASSRSFTRQNGCAPQASGLQGNKLNHSPSSPFVLREAPSKTKDCASNSIYFSQQGQHSQRENRELCSDNEFHSLWKELQVVATGTTYNQHSEQSQTHVPCFGGQAVQSSKQISDGFSHAKQKTSGRDGEKGGHKGSSNFEFNNMLKALSASESIRFPKPKKDSASRQAQTMASEDNKTDETSALLAMLCMNKDKTNDVKAKIPEGSGSVNKPGERKSNVQIPSVQTCPIKKQSPLQQSISRSYNATWELMKLVQSIYSGAVPLYTYMKSGPNQLTLAKVKLPNGICYCGQPSTTQEEAGESAALKALNSLKEVNFPDGLSETPLHSWPSASAFRPQLPPAFPTPQPQYVKMNASCAVQHPPPTSWHQRPPAMSTWWNNMQNVSLKESGASLALACDQRPPNFHRPEPSSEFVKLAPGKKNVGKKESSGNNKAQEKLLSNVDPNALQSYKTFIPMQVTKQNVATRRNQEASTGSKKTDSRLLAASAQGAQPTRATGEDSQSLRATDGSSSSGQGRKERAAAMSNKKKKRLAIAFDNELL